MCYFSLLTLYIRGTDEMSLRAGGSWFWAMHMHSQQSGGTDWTWKSYLTCHWNSMIFNQISMSLLFLIEDILPVKGVLNFNKNYVNYLLFMVLPVLRFLLVAPCFYVGFGIRTRINASAALCKSVVWGSEKIKSPGVDERPTISRRCCRPKTCGDPVLNCGEICRLVHGSHRRS